MTKENNIPPLATTTNKAKAIKTKALLKIREHPRLKWVGGGLLILLITAVAITSLWQPRTYQAIIAPSQLMPFVSAQEARIVICNTLQEGLFTEACQQKFNNVGKDDQETITALITLFDQAKTDSSVSDYDRHLLGQVVFGALPNKDSPTTTTLRPIKPWSSLVNHFKTIYTAHAQETSSGEEEFKALMEHDLAKVRANLPRGDNAWTINVMISRHSWQDGKRQPIYSEQYLEAVDPFPASTNINDSQISYHVKSFTGSWSSSQTASTTMNTTGTSEMITYSFSVMSWKSQPMENVGQGAGELYLTSTNHYSEEGFTGEDLLASMLKNTEPGRDQTGYKPIVPDAVRQQSEGQATDVADGSSSDPNCPFWVRYVDGPRLCFWTKEESLDFIEAGGRPPTGNLDDIIYPGEFNPRQHQDATDNIFDALPPAPIIKTDKDARLDAYNKWLECVKPLNIGDDSSHCDTFLEEDSKANIDQYDNSYQGHGGAYTVPR